MKKFTIKVLLVSAVIILAGAVVFGMLIPEHYLQILPFMLLFFLAVTLGIHAFQLQSAKGKNVARFSRSSMISTMAKLFLYAGFAVIYLAINSEKPITFVICLMVLYLTYTILEVSEMMHVVKK